MILAKNNIIVKIENSTTPGCMASNVAKRNDQPEYAILNPVSGSFDIMDEKEYGMYGKIGNGENTDEDFTAYMLERGYIYENSSEHEKAVNKAYDEFNKEVAASQVQLMLVPTYGCNLACTYCFQHGIEGKPTLISKETVDSFFEYAKSKFTENPQKPFITLFGGEPLVNSKAQHETIEYIIDKCILNDYELSVVTNGYDLKQYVDLLKKVKIKEIQVTLDGSQAVHDSRRATANSKGTFDRIIEGMEVAINADMPINLRSVVDIENIRDIVNLAEYLNGKGWLDLPPELFKTQIGRNYELFDCYAKPQHLMSQVELWAEYSRLSKKYPILSKFHRPDFKGIRHLVDTGEMYMASFDTCPACKTEWVFDLYGSIYGCTASCGREEYLLGTFWPEVELNNEVIETWKKRDVKSISKCSDCKYDVICVGGCGVVSANKNNGKILSPDCRPIQELMELGVTHYIEDIKSMAGDDADNGEDDDIVIEKMCCGCDIEDPEEEENCCCSGEQKEIQTGCVVCGKNLIYKETPSKETCSVCGLEYDSLVKCVDGHYICDSCHIGGILGKVEQLLVESNEKNPVLLAQRIFELPGLKMHGPEYHSIVPAVIVAAWQNTTGKKDASKVAEAVRRGADTKGGSCGFNGNCGAGVGSGIAASIIKSATPMSNDERGFANRATGYALIEISKNGGPRCCKREAITSIESFMQITNYFDDLEKAAYICKQYTKNKDCIYKKCSYFPEKQ